MAELSPESSRLGFHSLQDYAALTGEAAVGLVENWIDLIGSLLADRRSAGRNSLPCALPS